MTNKLNELKQIRDGAPDGAATHVEIAYKLIYWNLNSIHTALFYDGECWYRGSAVGVIHSLEDINARIELMEQVEQLQQENNNLKSNYVSVGFSNFYQLHYMQPNEFSEDTTSDSYGGMVYKKSDGECFKVFVSKDTWYEYQNKLKESK